MRSYQEEGHTWIQKLFADQNYKGCILADEMGLGKIGRWLFFAFISTDIHIAQAAATIVDFYADVGNAKSPCLIVAPDRDMAD